MGQVHFIYMVVYFDFFENFVLIGKDSNIESKT